MATERTLAIIKPDAVANNHVGEILHRTEAAGFTIRAMKMVRLTRREAEGFYAVHEGKPFFDELTAFMSSGPCIPLILEKDNAVADWRALIGATNPAEADEGTIRKDFAESLGRNAVHGSDSVANGLKESSYFFAEHEVVANA
jgi:nucleoside-diphosphate kinase